MTRLCDVLVLSRPLIGVDLETTSANPNSARIVEIGLEIFAPNREPREYRTLVDPECPIPEASTKKHGITDDMVKGAPKFRDLAANLKIGMVDCDFAGYNLGRFDLKVLLNEFRFAGHDWDYETARCLDSFRFWQEVEKRTLEDAIKRWCPEYLEEPLPVDGRTAHSALWDARAASRVIAAQIVQCGLPRDVQGLHDLINADNYDAEGKLRIAEDGSLIVNFGKHRGTPLADMDRGWLNWVMRSDFSDKVKLACQEALKSR
jgi:DNA polymerase-3 subunit epsilon